MRWLKFAVLSLLVCGVGFSGNLVQLEEGSSIEIPNDLFFGLSQSRLGQDGSLLTGHDKKGFTQFAFIRSPRTRDGSVTASGIRNPSILAHLNQQGIAVENLVPVSDAVSEKRLLPEVFRVENTPLFPNNVILVASRFDPEGSSHFLLLGPFKDFYRISPQFLTMVEKSQPKKLAISGGVIKPWMVLLAILLLVVNITVIWLGFREIAHPRELRADVG